MTQRPEDLKRRMNGLDEIGQVIGALRAIASGQASAAREASKAINAYRQTLVQATVGLQMPADGPKGRGVLIVIGAAQGFSGSYPGRILHALSAAYTNQTLLILGQRTLEMMDDDLRQIVSWVGELPGHVDQIPSQASKLTDAVIEQMAKEPGTIDILHGINLPGQPIQHRRVWPIDLAQTDPAGQQRLTTLPRDQLLSHILNELLFAELAAALTQGFEAENAARIDAMARAQHNLKEKRTGLLQAYQQARQDQTTTEIAELLSKPRS